ncbi:MAG: ABC transporter permease [Chloroflexi bacterium]|nr:ABC transporter permease [Chloroflexota bacterium]
MFSLWQLAGGVLRLDPQTFTAAVQHPGGTTLALAMVFLAGVSLTLGQSVVLFANQVSRRRFLFSLALYGLGLVLATFMGAGIIWVSAEFLFGGSRPYTDLLLVVALSYTPFLFGFLILLPYLGNIIGPLLRVWALLALITGVMVIYTFPLWMALICCIAGWLLLELMLRLPWLRDRRLKQWAWHLATGTTQPRETQDIVDEYVAQARAAQENTPALSSDKRSLAEAAAPGDKP